MSSQPRSRTWDAFVPSHEVYSIRGRKTYIVPECRGRALGTTEGAAKRDFAALVGRNAGVPGFRSLVVQTAVLVTVVGRISKDERILKDVKL